MRKTLQEQFHEVIATGDKELLKAESDTYIGTLAYLEKIQQEILMNHTHNSIEKVECMRSVRILQENVLLAKPQSESAESELVPEPENPPVMPIDELN